jgi:hypothetical protein
MVADLAAPHLRQDEQIVMTVYANVCLEKQCRSPEWIRARLP